MQKGDGGAYLRANGLHSSLMCEWRRQRDAGVLAGKKPGEKIGRLTAEQAEIARLRRQLDKAQRRLATTEVALEIMGKARELLEGLTKVTEQVPDVPAVASFDTAFHATIPAEAATYAVPVEWRNRYRVRRYGFHGLSHAYCARHVAMRGQPLPQYRTGREIEQTAPRYAVGAGEFRRSGMTCCAGRPPHSKL